MRKLHGSEYRRAKKFMDEAALIASDDSLCLRWHCGAVVVSRDGVIIGQGANIPSDRKPVTSCIKDLLAADFKSDRHCCVHAEQVAIDDALTNCGDQVPGASIYFMRLSLANKYVPAGKPFCTNCSKRAEFAGLAEFLLWHEDGIYTYPTHEYNLLSFAYTELRPKPIVTPADPPCPYARQLNLFSELPSAQRR